jgi:hypothetical protein
MLLNVHFVGLCCIISLQCTRQKNIKFAFEYFTNIKQGTDKYFHRTGTSPCTAEHTHCMMVFRSEHSSRRADDSTTSQTLSYLSSKQCCWIRNHRRGNMDIPFIGNGAVYIFYTLLRLRLLYVHLHTAKVCLR